MLNRSLRRSLAVAMLALMPLSGAVADTIKIGWVGPLSAPGNATAGEEMKWGALYAIEEINRTGGVLGSDLELVVKDTRGEPDHGASAMTELGENDGVVAVVGELHSSVALVEIEVAHELGLPWVGTVPWADAITAKNYPEVFRIAPADSIVFSVIGNWIAQAKFQRLAIVQEDTAWGRGGVALLRDRLEGAQRSLEVHVVPADVQDVGPEIRTIQDALTTPDLLMLLLAGDSAYPALTKICDAQLAPTPKTALFVSGEIALEPGFWDAAGPCGRYAISDLIGLPPKLWNDKAKQFNAAFTSKHDRLPLSVARATYDGVQLLADAMTRAKSSEPKAIVEALRSTDYVGTRGAYSFDTKTDPAWAYQQFMGTPVLLIQYAESGQAPEDAPVLAPRQWRTLKDYAKPE